MAMPRASAHKRAVYARYGHFLCRLRFIVVVHARDVRSGGTCVALFEWRHMNVRYSGGVGRRSSVMELLSGCVRDVVWVWIMNLKQSGIRVCTCSTVEKVRL